MPFKDQDNQRISEVLQKLSDSTDSSVQHSLAVLQHLVEKKADNRSPQFLPDLFAGLHPRLQSILFTALENLLAEVTLPEPIEPETTKSLPVPTTELAEPQKIFRPELFEGNRISLASVIDEDLQMLLGFLDSGQFLLGNIEDAARKMNSYFKDNRRDAAYTVDQVANLIKDFNREFAQLSNGLDLIRINEEGTIIINPEITITIPITKESANFYQVLGKIVKLAPRSASVLSVLIDNPEQAFTAQEIHTASGKEYDSQMTADSVVANISSSLPHTFFPYFSSSLYSPINVESDEVRKYRFNTKKFQIIR